MGGESPHHWHGVLDSALDAVGHTPLIRLDRIAKQEGFKCNLLAKCEFFSAGGSVKDRIAKRMVEEAEKTGRLIPGKSVVIEPTSEYQSASPIAAAESRAGGNTGIGLALCCALKGYQCIITLPAKMSLEKEVMLRALGAVIVRTPTEAAWDSPESHIGVARALQKSIPDAIILDQYSNPHNPLAHYHTTYGEIMYAIKSSSLPSKSISLLVAGAGTGGTITGIARAIRDGAQHGMNSGGNVSSAAEKRTRIVAVDPEGSILGGGEPGNYEVEGIGYDFFPDVLDPKPPLIDEWLKTNDSEAFAMTKRIMRVLSYAHIYIGLTRCSRTEGLFVGGSSGSALSGALRYLQSPSGQSIATDPTANVVVILPDGVRNYMSKTWFLDQADEPATAELRATIRGVLGRELGEPGKEKVEIEGGEEGKIEADDTEIGGLLEKALDGIGAGITTHGKLPVGWTNPAALGV